MKGTANGGERVSRDKVKDRRIGDQLDVCRQRGSNDSQEPAWALFPPDSPPSVDPAAPVVFQKLDALRRGAGESDWEREAGRGVSSDSGDSERGRVLELSRDFAKRDTGVCAVSQPQLKVETEQRLQGTSKVK